MKLSIRNQVMMGEQQQACTGKYQDKQHSCTGKIPES
jgi:hypothetical protein